MERILADHFKGLWEHQKNILEVDGMSLREVLLQEKRRAKNEGCRLGAKFYDESKGKYVGQDSPLSKLVVHDTDESLAPALFTALELSIHSNPAKRSKQSLYSFLTQGPSLNQREFVGLLRSILTKLAAQRGPCHHAAALNCGPRPRHPVSTGARGAQGPLGCSAGCLLLLHASRAH